MQLKMSCPFIAVDRKVKTIILESKFFLFLQGHKLYALKKNMLT